MAMEHLGTRILETDRLILRPFRLEDAEAMYRNWASDPEVSKFLTWPAHTSSEVTSQVIAAWVQDYHRKDFYNWAIILRSNGEEPIGNISVVSHSDPVARATMGYCIGRHWWRQGITSEALSRVIQFLIHDVGMRRVDAMHDVDNPNSGAVMRKCGMRLEGTMRQVAVNNLGIRDVCWYAILAEDLLGRENCFAPPLN